MPVCRHRLEAYAPKFLRVLRLFAANFKTIQSPMKFRLLLLSTIGMLLFCAVLHAQTHLYPETDVASVTSYSSAWAATPVVTGSSLTIAFQNKPGTVPAIWMNATTTDWTGAQGFVVDISNSSPGSIGIVIQVFDAPGDSGPNLWVQGSLDPGVSTIWSSNLNANSRTYGMVAAPPLVIGPGMTTSGLNRFGGTFGLGHVDHFKIQMVSYSGTGVPAINLRSLRISQPSTEAAMYTGLMDQFGQYAQGSWTNKVASASDFAARLSAENADLAANPVPSDRDAYGGWAAGPTLASATSGFFSAAQYNGKWWLVTPGGHLFFSVGIQGANPRYFPIGLSGRQYLLATQPPGGPYNYYDFYAANINLKYPSGASGWRTQTNARFKSWGMTTIGDYSDDALDLQHQLPYATEVDVSGGTGLVWIRDGAEIKVPDPFDDAFSSTVAGTLAPQFNSTTVNDPWCVGYFIDLWETGWPTYNDRYGLAVTVLNNPPTTGKMNCAKVQFVSDLTGEYTGIGSLNSAWGTSFASWSALLSATNWVPASQNAAMTADMAAYVTHFVSAYFQTVHQAFRAHDPNHLDLGARFGEPSPEVVAGAKSWMDVMSMDGPGGGPSSFNSSFWRTIALAKGSGKPWLTGAFMAGSTDSGMFQGWGANSRNQWDRGNVFQTYINILLSTSVFVGAHWYTNVDESLIGDTGVFKENFQEGFVDFCDTPYYPLVNAARSVNATIYKQHSYAGTARSADSNGMSTAVAPGLVEAESYDSGSNGVAYATASGMAPSTEACSDTGGGLDIYNVSSGDYWCYTINAAQAGSYTVGLRVSASSTGASLHIEDINGVNLSDSISIPATGGGQTWETVNATVSLTGGSQTIRVVADSAGFNFNNMSLYWMPYEGDFTIMNVKSSLFVAPVPYSARRSGIVQALPDNAADQRWHLTPTGGGYYTISSNDRSLKICPATNSWGWWYPAAGGTAPGDSITEWDSSAAYTLWELVPAGFTGYRLVNANSGLAMDVSGGSTANGAMLVQQPVSSGTSQVWIFGYVPGVAYMPVPQADVSLIWTASVNSTWDTATANWSGFNWINDNAAVFGSTGAGTVNIAGSVTADSVTISATGYTIANGTLALGGFSPTITANTSATISSIVSSAYGLIKSGTGTLTLSGANIYSGPTTIVSGILQAGAATSVFGANPAVTLSNAAATLDLNGYNGILGSLSGGGAAGGSVTLGGATLTVGGDNTSTTFAGVVNGGNINKLGSGTWTLSGTSNVGNATISGGVLNVTGYLYDPNIWQGGPVVAVGSGATLRLPGWGYAADNLGLLSAGAGNVVINGGTIDLAASNAWWENRGFTIGAAGATLLAESGVTFNIGKAYVSSIINNSSLILAGAGAGCIYLPITGSGSLAMNGSGTWVLSQANTYSGTTIISQGTLQILGSLAAGSAVTVGGGGILSGSGSIGGPVTVNGVLSPGTASIGSLKVTNTLALSGTASLRISKSGSTLSNDSVTGLSSVNYGGALVAGKTGSGTLAAGDTFTLFAAGSYTGLFSSITLPALGSGLQWNLSNLSVNGSISVMSATPWSQWQSLYFSMAQRANPAVSGYNAAPAGDGISNLLKYALGNNPFTRGSLPVATDVETLNGNRYLRLTVTRNAAATDVSTVIEVRGDFNQGGWSSANTTVEVNTATTLVVRDNIAIGTAQKRFIHLKVTHP
jgi:autotransporter-associated beta strand protein